jgi:hypothetical protein
MINNLQMTTIKERANNKMFAKIMHANIHLNDLQQELKSGNFKGKLTYDEMIRLVEGAKTELKVLNYIYKLIETNDDE